MGIKDFYKFLEEKYKHLQQKDNITLFSGKRIVVDVHGMIFKYTNRNLKIECSKLKNIAKEDVDKELLERLVTADFIRLVKTFYKHDIQPILIFDGEKIKDKTVELEKRKKQRNKAKDDLNTYIEEANKSDEISKDIRDKILKLKINQSLNYDSIQVVFSFLKNLGIPVYKSKTEAETTACMLVIDGKADAVYSEDSDCFAYLAPLVIRKIENNSLVTYYKLDDILQALELTKEQFLDFCILCGTDFNERISKIGPVKSLSYIKKYKNIENILNEELKEVDTSKLNYERCREIFSYKKFHETIAGYKNPEKCWFKHRHKKLKAFVEKDINENYNDQYENLRTDFVDFVHKKFPDDNY